MYLATGSTTNLFNNNIFTRVKDTMKALHSRWNEVLNTLVNFLNKNEINTVNHK